jgi:hypothetical protein
MTTTHMPPLVSELKEKKSQNLFGFGETLPGCLTFCDSNKTAGYYYRKTGRFLWLFYDR